MAKKVGIARVVSQALPEHKLRAVTQEIGAGSRSLMVGNGIND